MSRETLLKDLSYVTDTVAMMRRLMNKVDDRAWGDWNVAYEDHNIVDVGNGKWFTFENNLIPKAYADPNPHTDWITLWNPKTAVLVLKMLLDHCQGISMLVQENPELDDKIKVSQTVLDLCAQLRTYTIVKEQYDENGDLTVDRRTLVDIK